MGAFSKTGGEAVRAITLTFYDEADFRRFLREPGSFKLRELDIGRREISPLMVAIKRVLLASSRRIQIQDLIDRSLEGAARMGHRSNERTARRYVKRLVDDGEIQHVGLGWYSRDVR